MSKHRLILTLLITVFLVGGLTASFILVQKRQQITPKASTPQGTAYVSLNPTAKTVAPGDSFSVQVNFTTGGHAISAITAQIDYDYSGAEPPLTTGIIPNPVLTQDGSWSFPIKTFTAADGHATIKIAAVNVTQTGYAAAGDTMLATLNFTASNNVIGSITAEFDAAQSKITRKDTAEDILMTPSSVGNYVVLLQADPTATPTPPGYPTATPTPLTLPKAGNATPTFAIIFSGLAAIATGFFILLAL
jgi:hypothetical protein